MKRIIYVLSPFVAFFIGFIFLKLTVSAQAMPTPSADTLTLIEGGNNSLLYSVWSDVGVLPYNGNASSISGVITSASGDPLLVGTQLNAISSTDYDVRELTSTEIENNTLIYPYLYDVSGNVVNWDSVYFVHYDNGFCHGDLYIDNNGNILTSDSSNTYNMFQLGLGGSVLGVTDLANIYQSVATQLNSNSFIYTSDSNLNTNNLSYYLHYGYVNNSTVIEGYVYCPDIYDLDYVVPSNFTNGQSINLYFNSGANFTYGSIRGNAYVIQTRTNTVNGHSFTSVLSQTRSVTSTSSTSVTDFNNRVNGLYNLSATTFTYNSSLLHTSDTEAFKPLQFDTTAPLSIDDTYDYSTVKQTESRLKNLGSTPNTSYTPSNNTNSSNYPLNYNYNYSVASPSELPFPNASSEVLPDPLLDYSVVPEIEPSVITQSFSNLQIPFLSGIRSRFPFSIPWDIRDAFTLLKFAPEAPAWNFDWDITVLGTTYTQHFEGDLSDFSDLAELFRYLTLCAYIIGLAVFSYKQFF